MESSAYGPLSAAERDSLVPHLRSRPFRRGQTVFNDGDRGDCIYLVESGRFDVQVSTALGQMITLRVVQPGEWFGELALVHPGHRRFGRVCALEDSCTLVLHRRDFDRLRAVHIGIDRLLVELLADRVARTSELVVELLMSPETRVWRRLGQLADAYGDDPIRMSQDTLAHAAGTVRQTANRVLRIGVREGVLHLQRNEIRVLDRRALATHGSAGTPDESARSRGDR